MLVYDNYKVGNELVGIVKDIRNNYLILSYKGSNIRIYFKDIGNVEIGNKIKVFGEQIELNEKSIEHIFSFSRYSYSKSIVCNFKADSIIVERRGFNLYRIKHYLIKYIDSNFSLNTREYLKELILGISSFDENLNEGIKETGIIYLFCISGLHINIMTSYIKKGLRYINLPDEIVSIIISIFLIMFMVIANESSSIRRCVFMTILVEISSIFSIKISKTDILSISLFLNLIINPFQFYQIGFLLTYLSTFIIYISKIKNSNALGVVVLLFNAPIILYYNHELSLFIIFFSIFFGTIFSKYLIPFTYLTFIFNPLNFIYELFIKGFNFLINLSKEINIIIRYSITNIYYLIPIYISLFLIFMRKRFKKEVKRIALILSLILILNLFSGMYSLFPKIKMIDVGQGDSFLLRSGFSNVLIDTGNSDDYHSTINYLRAENVYYLSTIFISHYDSDHSGELESICDNIKVLNVTDSINEKTADYGHFHMTFYKSNLSTDNDSSLVIYMKVFNYKYLFTGDIESIGEKELLKENISDIDVLKVSHHGSKTSSSYSFLNRMKPKISLISVGLNNRYNHPNEEVLDRLNNINSIIYRTDLMGSVTITHYPFITYIKTYKNPYFNIFKRYKNDRFIFK